VFRLAACVRSGSPRRWLAIGGAATAFGLAVLATAPLTIGEPAAGARAREIVGGLSVVTGWLVLAWAIHRFGRER